MKNIVKLNKKAFTLVEMLVVVLIIGILAAIAVPQYQKAVEKSKITEAVNAIRSVASAEKIYYMTHNRYTNKLDELDLIVGQKSTSQRYLTSFWDIKTTELDYNYIFAGSTTDSSGSGYGASRYYVYYHIDNEQFFCCAHKNSSERNKLCRSITNNATSQGIESDSNLNCYPLNF